MSELPSPMPSTSSPPRRELRTIAVIAVVVGGAMCWLSLGDAGHPLRPALLVAGITAIFTAGWPLVVPRPVDDDAWWFNGAAAALLGGVVLGIGCALYLLGELG